MNIKIRGNVEKSHLLINEIMVMLRNLSALTQPVPGVSLDGVAQGKTRRREGALGPILLLWKSLWKTWWVVNAIDPSPS